MAFEDRRCLLLFVFQFILTLDSLSWTVSNDSQDDDPPLTPITDDRDEPVPYPSPSDSLAGPELTNRGNGADREP